MKSEINILLGCISKCRCVAVSPFRGQGFSEGKTDILKYTLLLLGFLFFLNIGNAQSIVTLNYHPDLIGAEYKVPEIMRQYSIFGIHDSKNILKAEQSVYPKKSWDDFDVDIDTWPVFCRIELQVEKAVNIPVKFRLGEVQYVERMEGKY